MPETMKLLESFKNKMTRVENGKNVLCLKITQVVLYTFESGKHLFPINCFVSG